MSIFSSLKSYSLDWQEVNSRKFTEEECSLVKKATVVPSMYGKSVCFLMANCKKYIPLEPGTPASIDDELNVKDLTIVSLHYDGTNPEQKIRDVLRIRVEIPKTPVQVQSFENPFGLDYSGK